MDRLIYIAMTGAKHAMAQQSSNANNLANSTTNGFRAELTAFQSAPVIGEGAHTRAFSVATTFGSDFSPGVIQQTGRELDVAVDGQGWIAVQTDNGGEAYTRAGSLAVGPNGNLQTQDGRVVLGDGGPIAVPPDNEITIAKDGVVSAVPRGQNANAVTVVGRIKLVNPEQGQLVRGDDGLFHLASGQTSPADGNVRLVPGAVETSNVNVVNAMVKMIAHARQYDAQIKMLQKADENSRQAGQLLRLNA